MSENRRTSSRHEVDLPCTVADDETREARVVNLSVGGALVRHPRRPMGHRVHLTFVVPAPANQTVSVDGIVRWSTDHEIGLQFDGLRPKDVWALNKYCESL